MVALWCVQYWPEERPLMSVVVKMLEGGVEIPMPKNLFRHHFMTVSIFPAVLTKDICSFQSESTQTSTQPSYPYSTLILARYEIEIATT